MNNTFSSSDMSIFPEILLDDIKSIKKIGTLDFGKKISIGDFRIDTLNVVSGIYDIYKFDDNLAIISNANNYLIDIPSMNSKIKKLSGITWKKYKFSIPVDSGTFGFYNTEKILELNKMMGEKKDHIPYIDWSKIKADTFIVGTNEIDKATGLTKKLPQYEYGVVSSSGTGDGIFDVYTTQDKSSAVILGGITMIKLYENNGLLREMPGNLSVYRKYMKRKKLIK